MISVFFKILFRKRAIKSAEDTFQTYLMFALVALLLLIGGGILQGIDLHLGIIASQLFCIAIPAFLLRKRFDIDFPIFFEKPNYKAIALVLVTTPLVSISSNLIALLIMQSSPALMEMGTQYQEGLQRLLHPDERWRQIVGLVGVCLVAPICEEYFFRGTLLQKQRGVHRWGMAIAINGVLFSLIHANPVAFVSLAVIGVYFASLSKRALFLSILAHAVLNSTSIILSFMPKTGASDADKVETIPVLIALAVLVPVAILMWRFTLSVIDEEK